MAATYQKKIVVGGNLRRRACKCAISYVIRVCSLTSWHRRRRQKREIHAAEACGISIEEVIPSDGSLSAMTYENIEALFRLASAKCLCCLSRNIKMKMLAVRNTLRQRNISIYTIVNTSLWYVAGAAGALCNLSHV